jgi:hypothetical protein
MGYSTYVVGRDSYVCSTGDWYEVFASQIRRMIYKSNWRILHIDGLEGEWALNPPGGYQKTRFNTKNLVLAAPYGVKQ